MVIYPYKNGSASAKALAVALGCKLLKREGKPRKVDLLINWGSSVIDRPIHAVSVLNWPNAIIKATNKLETFKAFRDAGLGVVCPEWSEDRDEAVEWLKQGFNVVERHSLTGHSGIGINIVDVAEGPGALTEAPCYTKYVPKKEEYRVHIVNGRIIFQQRKARKLDVPDNEVNWQVRNLDGGFIFANTDIVLPDGVGDMCLRAVQSLGLHFGAVDVGVGKAGIVVYEVNTACGLAGKTLDAYVNAFKEYKDE